MLPRPSPLLTPTISESSLPSPSVTESAGSANSAGLRRFAAGDHVTELHVRPGR